MGFDLPPKPQKTKSNVMAIVAILMMLSLSACGITISEKHPSLQSLEDPTPAATVYFIRPALIKPKGFADKPVKIEFQGQQLLEISQGHYLMIKLKPGKGEIVTHSLTKFTNQIDPIPVSRKRSYDFLAGYTYFIYVKQLNEEFRGVFYDPMSIDLDTAKQIIRDARPYGAAKSALIDDIESVPEPPKASKIEPAFPETLYKPAPYLLKKPVAQ